LEPRSGKFVDAARTNAVIDMTGNDQSRLRRDLLIACSLFAAGALVIGMSLAQIEAQSQQQLAQATPPLQGTPSSENKNDAPAQSKPGGDRPTTPAPEPARPDPQTQGAAKPALPPAPAEKVAPPIKEKQ
jgi:hypothetical protein